MIWARYSLVLCAVHMGCISMAAPQTDLFNSVENCVNQCIEFFSTRVGSLVYGEHADASGFTWQSLLQKSSSGEELETITDQFDSICDYYTTVKRCLSKCPNGVMLDVVAKGFEAFKLICVQAKTEFFNMLPCFAANERRVVQMCEREINQTVVATQMMQKTVEAKEHHNLRVVLTELCKGTSSMMRCYDGPTRLLCGDPAADMLARLLSVSFSNFQDIYVHLGLNEHLPPACRSLVEDRTLGSRRPPSEAVLGRPSPDLIDTRHQEELKHKAATHASYVNPCLLTIASCLLPILFHWYCVFLTLD